MNSLLAPLFAALLSGLSAEDPLLATQVSARLSRLPAPLGEEAQQAIADIPPGLSLEEALQQASQAPAGADRFVARTLAQALTEPDDPVDWVIDGLFARPGLAIMEGAAAAEATAAAAPVAVNAGSAVAKNAALVVAEPDAFQLAGLGQAGGALNVVGGSGLNAALRKSLNGFAAGKVSGGLING